jgi:hypothetical protein
MTGAQDRFEELVSRYLDGTAGEAEVGELAGMLRGNPDRMRLLARLFVQHGTLAWIHRGAGASGLPLPGMTSRTRVRPRWIAIPLAASLLVTFLVVRYSPSGGPPGPANAILRSLSFQDGASPSPSYAGTRDVRLSNKDVTENRGSDSFIEVESSSEPGGRPTLLQWDLREIPAGSSVVSVSITLAFASVSREQEYVVHAMKRPWIENEATWLDYAAGKPWSVAGGKGPDDRGSETLALFTPRRGASTFDLTPEGVAVVQSWIDLPASNRGFIVLSTGSQGEFYAHSRESEMASSRPKLSVTFRPPTR